ncbi:hypothetical protein BDA96_07G038400 [Sorghum bicolor]|uniref:Uncharacterized protein n=2 Tax=Sorghum bicolor TaxID=4558 RepID=A0A921QIM3_SORBI|nr:hypothetical protein BDA96_07G038400 [Sorghum bicolor]OQU79858.1 hypothetical protein SORBI_3007G036550 [Sorghum bicolor]
MNSSTTCYDVSPLALLCFMWEQQSQWTSSNLDAFFASTMKPNFFNLPMSRLGGFSGQVMLPCILHKVKQCSVCLIFNMFN